MRTTISATALTIGMVAGFTLAAQTVPSPRLNSHGSPAAVTLLLAHRVELGLTETQAGQLAALDPARRPVIRAEVVGLDRVPGKAGVPQLRTVTEAPRGAVAPQEERIVITGLDRVPGKSGVPVYRKEVVPVQHDVTAVATAGVRITGLDRVPGKSVPTIERVFRPAPFVDCPLIMLTSEQMAKAHMLLAEADLL